MHRFTTVLRPLAAAALALGAAPAFAADAAPLTYEMFEVAVPHLDLETCPEALAGAARFCRATLNHEEFHVFAFSEEGDRPMLAMRSYPAEGLDAIMTAPLD